jgi:hypothetical protein
MRKAGKQEKEGTMGTNKERQQIVQLTGSDFL